VIKPDHGNNQPHIPPTEPSIHQQIHVAGRAGRGPKGGEVLIQTRAPTHHAVRCAVTHDYHAFVREELAGRRTPPYPPNLRLANVVVSGVSEDATARLATRAVAWLHRLLASHPSPGVTVIGPAPCPVERVNQRWRWHLLLKGDRPQELGRVARYFVEHFEIPKQHGLRMTLDRDPVALL
jgi:primosomal protein N' (replication factor Y)